MKRCTRKTTQFTQKAFSAIILSMLMVSMFVGLSPISSKMNGESINKDTVKSSDPIQMTGQVERVIVLFDTPVQQSWIDAFGTHGGTIVSGPWNTTQGFAGVIMASEANLGAYLTEVPQATAYPDSVVEGLMNFAARQLGYFPNIWDGTLNRTGNTNSSIAVIDSGIDPSSVAFKQGYADMDFDSKIIYWKDYVESAVNPVDKNGHGTAVSAIAAADGNDANPKIEGDYIYSTIGGKFSHEDLYPNHFMPGTYKIKLASIIAKPGNYNLEINALLTDLDIPTQLNSYKLTIYGAFGLLNESVDLGSGNMQLSLDMDEVLTYTLDVYLEYAISFGKTPSFTVNGTASYQFYEERANPSNYSGIAYNSKIAALRVLNETGKGYVSDVLSALDFVWANNFEYQITSAVLALGSTNIEEEVVEAISNSIDQVIENGTMVIIAAGNYGVGSNKLNALAKNAKAIVVGSVNDENRLTYYSSQGQTINGDIIKPDVLAPGGSRLASNRMIQSHDANTVEPNGLLGEESIANDTAFYVGTSVSASILSGIYQTLLESYGTWNNFTHNEEMALSIKAALLATATETNALREDNPITGYDESLNSPNVNRVGKDVHEGYGIVNPKAAIDLISTPILVNSSSEFNISASNTDILADHAIGRKITLEKNKYYQITINSTMGLDADLYLFHNVGDSNGEPILLRSSNEIGTSAESITFCPSNNTREYWIVVKAIDGEGTFTLNVTELSVSMAPQLSNSSLQISSDNSDILDGFTFSVIYSHPDNVPAQFVYLVTNVSATNYTLSQSNPLENNYTIGVLYELELKFNSTGNVSYYFSAFSGEGYTRDPAENLSVMVYPISDSRPVPYSTDFSDWETQSQYWGCSQSLIADPLNMDLGQLVAGWEQLTIPNNAEFRGQSQSSTNWNALYCGLSLSGEKLHSPILRTDGSAYYDYTGLTGTYNLETPTFLIDSNTYPNLNAKLGYRVSLGSGSQLNIQVVSNRTNITTVLSHTNEEFGWKEITIDLKPFNGSYIQIRFNAILSGLSMNYRCGIMVDYFSIENSITQNDNAPFLENPSGPTTNLDFVSNVTRSSTKFDMYEFRVMVSDLDGDAPKSVVLEIDGINFTMENVYGKWNAVRNESTLDKYYGIYYSVVISIEDFYQSNDVILTYCFHAFDGKSYNSTEYIDFNISFETPELIKYPLVARITEKDVFIGGNPNPKYTSAWVSGDNQWHRIRVLDKISEPGEWYCGALNNSGYGSNWNAYLTLKPMLINETYEAFLWFDYKLNVNSENDYLDILVSKDYGQSWESILRIQEAANEYNQVAIKLNQYKRQTIMIRFAFVSTNTLINYIPSTGAYLRGISVNLNITKDYFPPTVTFLNLVDSQKVSGKIRVQISITDNGKVDFDRLELYVDGYKTNFDLNESVIEFDFNSKNYEDLLEIEIAVVAYDKEGNRVTKKLVVTIDNRMPWGYQLLIGLIAAGVLVLFIAYAKRKQERDPDSIFAVGIAAKYEEFQKKKLDNRLMIQEVLDTIDENVEKLIPMILTCKSCKRWFSSTKFDIYCPKCGQDAIYVAKECPLCERYYLFEMPGKDICKKHKFVLPNDFRKTMELIDAGHYSVESINEHPELLKHNNLKREAK